MVTRPWTRRRARSDGDEPHNRQKSDIPHNVPMHDGLSGGVGSDKLGASRHVLSGRM